jgi:hypothetical protein
MYKFHQIPTLDYEPISHDKTYLFSNYEKLSNFLIFNLDRESSDILAKPIKTQNYVDWYSNHSNLVQIENLSFEEKEKALVKYWTFLDKINSLISKLRSSKDNDKTNWSNILEKTFNSQNNLVFSNGNEIAIVWGWSFYNNKNYKPSILPNITSVGGTNQNSNDVDSIESSQPIIQEEFETNSISEDEEIKEELEEDFIEPIIYEEEIIEEEKRPSGFLNFLKWFASKYWWILLLLLLLFLLLLILKNCEHQRNYERLNHEIENIEGDLNNVCR